LVALYWQISRRGFRRYATYRSATVAGIFTNTVFGFIRAYVFITLLSTAGAIAGYGLSDTLTYTFVTQGMLMTVYMWAWWEIALSVRSGDVVTDLYRPIDYQLYWLAQDLGRAAYHFVARGIPPFIAGALVFHLHVPADPLIWGAFLGSVAMAVCVSFAMRFMANLAAFWLLDYRGVGNLLAAAWTFLGGFIVPIAFFPEPLRSLARALPFAATIQTPIDVYLGEVKGTALASALLLQALWAAVLLIAGRGVLAAATRRVVTQGG
jgi:ABC-2 type transport system permease protein